MRRLLVVLALVTVPVLMPAPAGACSCAEVEATALLEQVRAGAVVVGGVQVGPVTDGAITVAVREAVGEDVGPRLQVPVLAPVERVDPTSGEVHTASSSCDYFGSHGSTLTFLLGERLDSCSTLLPVEALDALQVEPPVAAAGPVRFLGPAPDPYGGQAGYDAAGEYAGILGEDVPQGRVVRCPGDAAAWVLEGAQLFDGHNGQSWWRVDTASLTGEPLVRRAQVNGDPFANPNILTDVRCLDPEGRDLVALFTWYETPDVKPQRLVRVFDSTTYELARAPIWNVWAHVGEVCARVDRDGGRIVRVDLGDGSFTDVGTLPTDLRYDDGYAQHVPRLHVAEGGAFGVLTVGSPGAYDLLRVDLPTGVLTAIARVEEYAQPLADGRTAMIRREAPIQLLDAALQPVLSAALPVVGGLLLDGPDGAWFGAGALTWRLPPDASAPTSVPVEADTVLAQPATPALSTAPPERIPTFAYELDLTPPTARPTSAPTAEPPPSAEPPPPSGTRATPPAVDAPSLDAGAPSPPATRATWWPAALGVMVAVLLAGTWLSRRR